MRMLRSWLLAGLVAGMTSSAAAQDITTGLIGHWKLSEASGTTAADSSSYAVSGTVNGGASWSTRCSGINDFDFNGSSHYISIPNAAHLQPTAALSIAGWIRGDAWGSGSNVDIILRKGEGNPNNYQLAIADGRATLYLDQNDVQGTRSNTVLATGQWYHVAATWDGATVRIYVNGQLDNSASRSGTIATDTRPLYVGGRAGTDFFNGMIYDVRFYNRALTPEDVATLYGFIGHWQLNETSGTTAADATTFGGDGTVNGGASWTTNCSGSGAFDFNGSSQYVSIANAANLQPTSMLTIAAWIYGDAWGSGSDVDVILRKGEGNPNNYQLAIADGQVALYLDASDSAGIRSTTTLTTGEWNHVAATWDGATVNVYVNGQLDNSVARTGTIATDTRPLYVGGRAGADYFDGMIRDVRFYNRPLCASEIAAMYDFVGHWKLDETSGTTAADSAPFGNNGTVTGGANWSTRCSGVNVFDFNGSSNYVSIPNASSLQPTSKITMAAWIRGDSWGSGSSVDAILRKGEGNPNNYQLAIADGRATLYLDDSDVNGIRGDTVLTAGEWYHVAATWDGATASVYVNGQLDMTPVSRAGTIATDTRPLYIGGRASSDYFDGMIYDARLYNRSLCASEIAELYGLVGHWKLDETAGVTAVDSSPLANDATYQGSPTLGASGAVDTAVDFNGSNYAITNATFSPPSTGTVVYWMKRAGAPVARERFFGAGGNWEIWQDPDGLIRCDLGGDGYVGGFESVTSMVTPNKWYHIAATFDAAADTFAIYVDGALDVSGSMALSPQAAAQLSIAARTGLSIERFQGTLDDLRIYNRVLCPTEIQQLYNGGSTFSGVRIIQWQETQ